MVNVNRDFVYSTITGGYACRKHLNPSQNGTSCNFTLFFRPAIEATSNMPALHSQGNRPLQMTFEEHLRALVYFHLEEHHSAQHLLQELEEDDFVKSKIASDSTNNVSINEAFGLNRIKKYWQDINIVKILNTYQLSSRCNPQSKYFSKVLSTNYCINSNNGPS